MCVAFTLVGLAGGGCVGLLKAVQATLVVALVVIACRTSTADTYKWSVGWPETISQMVASARNGTCGRESWRHI